MAFPLQNSQVVAQGLARLTSAFITKPNVRAMLSVYLRPFQEVENVLFDVIQLRILANAEVYALPETNSVFDSIGAIVGILRNGESDASYLAMIYLEIAVNRSTGRITDWSRFAQLLAPWCDEIVYLDGDNADFDFALWNLTQPPLVVARSLSRAVPNAVYCHLSYSTWEDTEDIRFGYSLDASAGSGGWGYSLDPTPGGVLVAGIGLP